MKRKVEKEPEGGTKKRKEVWNDNSLASMFAKQQAVSVLNQERDTYNAQIQRAKFPIPRGMAPFLTSSALFETDESKSC